jgi:hypothetical protein
VRSCPGACSGLKCRRRSDNTPAPRVGWSRGDPCKASSLLRNLHRCRSILGGFEAKAAEDSRAPKPSEASESWTSLGLGLGSTQAQPLRGWARCRQVTQGSSRTRNLGLEGTIPSGLRGRESCTRKKGLGDPCEALSLLRKPAPMWVNFGRVRGKSGRGQPHSKIWRSLSSSPSRAPSALDCGSPLPLFRRDSKTKSPRT